MSGIETNFYAIEKSLIDLEERVRQPLSIYVRDKDWLLISRRKTIDSVIDKISTGRYKKLEDFDDLIAFSIITDLRSNHREVISFVKRTFDVQIIRGKSTLSDERVFDFDSIRVYAKLPLSIPNTQIGSITFEIQIRTILQHAWSKITHPLVYKPRNIDSKKIRLASEILANIEALDRTLSTFSTSSKSVKNVSRVRSSQLNTIIEKVDQLIDENVIPAVVRPGNGRRFSESVLTSIDFRKSNFKDAVTVIENFYRDQEKHFPISISLYQLAVVALHRNNSLNIGTKNKPRYYYVTSEMVSLFPDAAAIKPTVEI